MAKEGVWAARRAGTSWAWRKRRAWWAGELARVGSLPCGRCRLPIVPGDVWHLDHVDAEGNDSSDDAVTRPSHAACNLLHGRLKQMEMAVDRSRARRPAVVPSAATVELVSGEPGGLGPDDARSVPWLADYVPIVTWPRLMSGMRPDAAGSLGVEAIEAIEGWRARPLWPWQRLALVRALEVDAAGKLVWRVVVLTVPRQVGKSTCVGEAAAWRLRSCERFGEPQDVLHVARDLAAAVQVQRPHRIRAEQDRERFHVRTAGGRMEIEHRIDGGRWLLRSVGSVYSYSASMGIVDEAWDVDAEVVDDGIGPVLLQRDQAQLWLVSTANAAATSLMLGRRAAAMAELDEPSRTLWMEWSAAPDADVSDPVVWERSAPHWSEHIAEFYREKYDTALATRLNDPAAADPVRGFAQQYLNQWPKSVEPVRKGKPLVDIARWRACAIDDRGLLSPQVVVALDEHWEGGVSLVVASATDAGFYLEAMLYPSRTEAFARVGELRQAHQGATVLASQVLMDDAKKAKIRAKAVGAAELTAALPVLRTVVGDSRLAHYDVDDLTEQLEVARAVVNGVGQLHLQLDREHRLDTLRAALWALGRISKPRPQPSIF